MSMDYDIKIDTLTSKQSEFETLKSNVEDIYNELNNCSINSLPLELSSLKSSLRKSITRLKTGYTNSNTWLKKYVNELSNLEDSIASFSSSSLDKPIEFKGEFIDLFGKKTLYKLQTGYVDPRTLEGNLAYGTYELKSFRASNGVEIPYYVYVPEGAQENLPVMLYMHGGSAHGTSKSSWLNYGLPNMISNREVTPQGIIICPYIRNFEGDNIGQGLIELTNSVVNEYKADTNRISLSGHSYGAITGYKMVNNNPNYFSAFVPISGWSQANNQSFNNVNVWAFHGSNDNSGSTSCSGAQKQVNYINSSGGNASMYIFKGGGHAVQGKVYEGTFMSPDGKEESPLEWALRQTKG